MTKAIDPRQGLHRNLNLLEAYKVYEKDYPLLLPDISATLAMNSPLFSRIDETLTLQSLNKSEYEQDEAQLRGAAVAGGVPLEQLRQAFRIFREFPTTTAGLRTTSTANANAVGPSHSRWAISE